MWTQSNLEARRPEVPTWILLISAISNLHPDSKKSIIAYATDEERKKTNSGLTSENILYIIINAFTNQQLKKDKEKYS